VLVNGRFEAARHRRTQLVCCSCRRGNA
jgi:hypothetical protein